MPKKFKIISDLDSKFALEIKKGLKTPQQLLKDDRLKQVFASIKEQPFLDRITYGQQVNALKDRLKKLAQDSRLPEPTYDKGYLDVTSPLDINQSGPPVLADPQQGSVHPVMQTQAEMCQIIYNMGFKILEPRLLDDQYYMFDSLNFPEKHPSRHDYDTFYLSDTDQQGRPLLAPGHTSSMQNRVLKQYAFKLDLGEPLAVAIPGPVFRNEDVDASHDHMFYQLEGIFVARDIHLGHLVASLKEFLESYFKQDLDFKMQPAYFPFTEPSLEVFISCPFCRTKDCSICSQGFIEILGCGMIHPNVLEMAGIDSKRYSGFAWGIGLSRITMIKHNIEDIRHLTSSKLDFLRQFKS